MFYELIRLALDNLMRARTRLIMTAGGVLVGTTAVILLVALTFGLQRAAEVGMGASTTLTEIRVYPGYGNVDEDGNFPMLNAETFEAFSQIPGVLAVIPLAFCYGGGELTAGDLVNYGQVVGIDPALLSYLGVEVEQGELSLEAGKVIIGGLIDDYFVDPNSTEWEPVAIDLATTPIEMGIYSYTGDRREIELDISGVLREGAGMYDGTIFMPLEDVIELNEWVMGARIDMRDFTYDQAVLRAESREATNAITEAIIEMGFQTDGMGDFLDQLNNFFTTMRLMLGGVGGIALLVAAFGVANTMTMAILERTKEIGLMKAIGARDRDVLTVFLIEAGLIGMCGGAAGVAVSLILQNTINQAMQNAPTDSSGIYFLPFDPSQIGDQLLIIPTELSLFAIGLATLVGLGAGLLPALRAARLPPVIALKQE